MISMAGMPSWFGPFAAWAAVGADVQRERGAVHGQGGVIVAGDLPDAGVDVVADQRSAEPVGGAVDCASVHEGAVEEQHVARAHAHGAYRGAGGQGARGTVTSVKLVVVSAWLVPVRGSHAA